MNRNAIDRENRLLLERLAVARERGGGDVSTPTRLLDHGTPEEIDAYVGSARKLRSAWCAAVLVAVELATAAFALGR